MQPDFLHCYRFWYAAIECLELTWLKLRLLIDRGVGTPKNISILTKYYPRIPSVCSDFKTGFQLSMLLNALK